MWAFKIKQLGSVCIKNDQVYLLFAFSFALADILFAGVCLRFPVSVVLRVCMGSGLGGFKGLTPSASFLKDNSIVTR